MRLGTGWGHKFGFNTGTRDPFSLHPHPYRSVCMPLSWYRSSLLSGLYGTVPKLWQENRGSPARGFLAWLIGRGRRKGVRDTSHQRGVPEPPSPHPPLFHTSRLTECFVCPRPDPVVPRAHRPRGEAAQATDRARMSAFISLHVVGPHVFA